MDHNQKTLQALLRCTPISKGVKAAVEKMSSTLYTQQNGSLSLQSSDGMARHTDFNRALADYIQRNGPAEGIRFERSKRKDIDYIGNWVFGNKVGGQQRFTVLLQGKTFELLHMSGTVTTDRIQVYAIGKKREEFVKNQSRKVSKSQSWDIAGLSDQTALDLPMSWPSRLALVSEICGPRKNSIKIYLCLTDGQYNKEEGLISIVASILIAEVPVTGATEFLVQNAPSDTEEKVKKPLISAKQKPKKDTESGPSQTSR